MHIFSCKTQHATSIISCHNLAVTDAVGDIDLQHLHAEISREKTWSMQQLKQIVVLNYLGVATCLHGSFPSLGSLDKSRASKSFIASSIVFSSFPVTLLRTVIYTSSPYLCSAFMCLLWTCSNHLNLHSTVHFWLVLQLIIYKCKHMWFIFPGKLMYSGG